MRIRISFDGALLGDVWADAGGMVVSDPPELRRTLERRRVWDGEKVLTIESGEGFLRGLMIETDGKLGAQGRLWAEVVG